MDECMMISFTECQRLNAGKHQTVDSSFHRCDVAGKQDRTNEQTGEQANEQTNKHKKNALCKLREPIHTACAVASITMHVELEQDRYEIRVYTNSLSVY